MFVLKVSCLASKQFKTQQEKNIVALWHLTEKKNCFNNFWNALHLNGHIVFIKFVPECDNYYDAM